MDLREFVKDFQEKVATFCAYFMPADAQLDDLMIDIFRRFGEDFRKYVARNDGKKDPLEMKIRLFKIASERLADALLVENVTWTVGRDFRKLKVMDENLLLEGGRDGDATLPEPSQVEAAHRLRRVDAENRAAVILKDILGFEDEEVLRMLGLRWGVYRHRLHRGRLDYCEVLKGAAAERPEGQSTHVSW